MTSNTKLFRIGDLHCPVESDHIGHAREEEEHGDNPGCDAAGAAHHLPKTNQKIGEFAQLAVLIVLLYFVDVGVQNRDYTFTMHWCPFDKSGILSSQWKLKNANVSVRANG